MRILDRMRTRLGDAVERFAPASAATEYCAHECGPTAATPPTLLGPIDIVVDHDVAYCMYENDETYRQLDGAAAKRVWAGAFVRNRASHRAAFAQRERDMCRTRDLIKVIVAHQLQYAGTAVVFDVGAFVGQFGIPVALWASANSRPVHVYCFEPGPTAGLLVHNVALNDVASHLTPIVCVAADYDGPGLLHFDSEHLVAGRAYTPDSNHSTILTQAVTLDGFVESCGAGGSSLLVKIDTEGFEVQVLRGMRELLTRRNLAIVLEFRPWLLDSDEGRAMFAQLERDFAVLDVGDAVAPASVMAAGEPGIRGIAERMRERGDGYRDVLFVAKAMPAFAALHSQLLELR